MVSLSGKINLVPRAFPWKVGEASPTFKGKALGTRLRENVFVLFSLTRQKQRVCLYKVFTLNFPIACL